MRLAVALVDAAACGRIDFDGRIEPIDAPRATSTRHVTRSSRSRSTTGSEADDIEHATAARRSPPRRSRRRARIVCSSPARVGHRRHRRATAVDRRRRACLRRSRVFDAHAGRECTPGTSANGSGPRTRPTTRRHRRDRHAQLDGDDRRPDASRVLVRDARHSVGRSLARSRSDRARSPSTPLQRQRIIDGSTMPKPAAHSTRRDTIFDLEASATAPNGHFQRSAVMPIVRSRPAPDQIGSSTVGTFATRRVEILWLRELARTHSRVVRAEHVDEAAERAVQV